MRGERAEVPADEDLARRWRWAYVDEARGERRRKVLGLPKEGTLGEVVEAFLGFVMNHLEPNTHHGHRTSLRHLLDAFGHSRPLHAIDPKQVQGVLDKMVRQGYRASTLGRYASSWKRMLRWADAEGIWGDLVVPDPGKQDVETLEPLDLAKLRQAASTLDRDGGRGYRMAVECVLGTGVRRSELFALRWSDFNERERSVRIDRQVRGRGRATKPLKGKKARTALVLPSWWDHHHPSGMYVVGEGVAKLSGRARDDMMQRVLDRAGLNETGRGWHVLRHQYARHFLESGGRIQELQRSLGHSSVLTTERYYQHFSEDAAVRLARERIYGG